MWGITFGAITLFKIAMMQICECSAKMCFALARVLKRQFLEMNFGTKGSRS